MFVNNYHINKFHDKLSFRLQRQNCIERSLLGNAFAYILIMRRHGNSILFRLTRKTLSALWKVFLSLSYAIFLSRFSFGKTMGLRECCFLPMLTCSDVSCEDLFLTLTSTKRSTCTGVGICFNEQIHIAK